MDKPRVKKEGVDEKKGREVDLKPGDAQGSSSGSSLVCVLSRS